MQKTTEYFYTIRTKNSTDSEEVKEVNIRIIICCEMHFIIHFLNAQVTIKITENIKKIIYDCIKNI